MTVPPDRAVFDHLVVLLGPAADKSKRFAALAARAASAEDYDQAALALAVACAGAPESADYRTALASLFRKLGWLEWAAESFTQAVGLGAKDIHTYLGLGETLLDLAEYTRAAAALAQAIALDPAGRDPAGIRARALALKASRDLAR